MANKVSYLEVLRKIDEVAAALQDFIEDFFDGGGPLLRPAQTFRNGKGKDNREKGHDSIRMIIESFEWQRERSDRVIKLLEEFDVMLDNCDKKLGDVILKQLAISYIDYNSDNMTKNTGLMYFFRETLPAVIYWAFSDIDRIKLEKLFSELES